MIASEEFYFVHRTGRFEPSAAGRTALELRYIHGHRWCDATTIGELVAHRARPVYPLQLGELLAEANRLADGRAGTPAAAAVDPLSCAGFMRPAAPHSRLDQ